MERKGEDKKLGRAGFWSMAGSSFKGTFFFYALSILLIVIGAVGQAAEPVIYGRIVDALVGGTLGGDIFAALLPLVGLWAGAYFLGTAAKQGSELLSWKAGHRVLKDFSRRTFEKILYWDADRFGKTSPGVIAKRVDVAWGAIWSLAGRLLTDLVPTLITFVVFLAVGLYLDWRMALISLAGVPLLLTLTIVAYRYAEAKQDSLNDAWETTSRRLYESMQNILPIKSFVGEERILAEHVTNMGQVADRQEALNTVWIVLDLANATVRLASRLAVILGGLFYISNGTLSVGALVTFLGMVGYILAPFDYLLADIMRRISEIKNAFARLQEDWDVPNRIVEKKNARKLTKVAGEITYNDVSFRFRDANRDTLSGINLGIPAGTSLAIVGPSGSGKSTLVKFLNRFLEPTKGTVCIDGLDVKDLRLADLRKAIGVVHQDTVLFNDSVLENVRFANPKATRAEVVAACKKAQADEFITRMEKGYDTLVGERGIRMSGGERQRLALARVFVANPPILILDESTSALDSETEYKLQLALQDAMQGRTTIIIAHRLSTVYLADQIAVIERGKLIELGNHADLLKEGGVYERLWRMQSGGYLPE